MADQAPLPPAHRAGSHYLSRRGNQPSEGTAPATTTTAAGAGTKQLPDLPGPRVDTPDPGSSGRQAGHAEYGTPPAAVGGSRPALAPVIEGEDDHLMRRVDRPPPGDVTRASKKGKAGAEEARQRSHYFEDVFVGKPSNQIADQVRSEAMIVVDLKTNVIIHDEFTFMYDVTRHFANRYARPERCVALSISHTSCMLFSGSFDPAYIMTVTALPCELTATVNRRNAALLQQHMHEALGVPPARGLITFMPADETCLATNCETVAGEIAEREAEPANNGTKAIRARRRLSVKSLSALRALTTTATPAAATAQSAAPTKPAASPSAAEITGSTVGAGAADQATNAAISSLRQVKPRRSFVANLFSRRSASKTEGPGGAAA